MSLKGNAKGLERRDPAVTAIFTDAAQREERRALTKSQRRKRDLDAARSKVTVDLPPELVRALQQLAAQEGVSLSGLIAYYAAQGILRHDRNALDSLRSASRSPRFEWKLDLEPLLAAISSQERVADSAPTKGAQATDARRQLADLYER